MAITTGNSQLSAYDSKIRLLGLNNNLFNTNDLVDAELQILDLQAQPQRTQQKLLQQEKTAWSSFKSDVGSFTDTLETMRLFNPNQKSTSYSEEGFATVTSADNALDGEYLLKVDSVASRHQLAGKELAGTEVGLGIDDTVKLNGKDLTLSNTMTLRDIVKTVNDGDYGASATIIGNRLILTAKNEGIDNQISLADGVNKGLESLGVVNADGTFANELSKASNAAYSINGISLSSSTNTIENVIDGTTLNLQNPTSGKEIKITVKSDTSEIVKKVQDMVTAYNKNVNSLKSYSGESGLLQGQTIPLNIRRDMGQFSAFVSPTGHRTYEFGLELDKTTPKDGFIALDTAKLEEQLKKNPNAVIETFFGEDGLGKFMKDKLDKYTSDTGTIQTKLDGLDKNLETVSDALVRFDVQYTQQKNSILDKYAAFETMMAGLNSSLQYMEAQMNSLSGNKN